MDDVTSLMVVLCIFAFSAGFICSNELVVRMASRAEGYKTNRGKIIKVVSL